MYSKAIFPIPDSLGKITFKAIGSVCYVYLELSRKFVQEKRYDEPKHVVIGKLVNANDRTRMYPNENYFKYCRHVNVVAESATPYAALVAQAAQARESTAVTFKEIAPSTQKGIRLSPEVCAQLKELGLTLDSSVDFDSNGLLFEPGVYLCEGCSLDRPSIGAYSYSSINSSLTTVKLGRFCSIGHGVEFGLYEHPLHHVTTSPALSQNIFFMDRSGAIPFNPAQLRSDGLETNVVTLGNDVWVGGHCLFPKDVTIGHGAVIGAGSIITHDVPPYAIVAGSGGGTNSHGIIRGYRFSDEIISDLLELSWWEYDLPKMVASGIKVPTTDVKDFISFMKNEEREHFIPLHANWYYLNAIDSQAIEIYNVDPEQTYLGNAVSSARLAIINDPEFGAAPIKLKR